MMSMFRGFVDSGVRLRGAITDGEMPRSKLLAMSCLDSCIMLSCCVLPCVEERRSLIVFTPLSLDTALNKSPCF